MLMIQALESARLTFELAEPKGLLLPIRINMLVKLCGYFKPKSAEGMNNLGFSEIQVEFREQRRVSNRKGRSKFRVFLRALSTKFSPSVMHRKTCMSTSRSFIENTRPSQHYIVSTPGNVRQKQLPLVQSSWFSSLEMQMQVNLEISRKTLYFLRSLSSHMKKPPKSVTEKVKYMNFSCQWSMTSHKAFVKSPTQKGTHPTLTCLI